MIFWVASHKGTTTQRALRKGVHLKIWRGLSSGAGVSLYESGRNTSSYGKLVLIHKSHWNQSHGEKWVTVYGIDCLQEILTCKNTYCTHDIAL
jgi:hypothetical protein